MGWIVIAAWAVLGLTFLTVGIVKEFARQRAAMLGGFWLHGRHYLVAQDRDQDAGLHGEVASIHELEPLLFSPPFDKESFRSFRHGRRGT